MNLKSLGRGLATMTLSLTSACIYTAPEAGNVTFAWAFDGLSCYEDGRVRDVRITIPGESLQFGGVYPCNSNGYDGVTLYDFRPGSYEYFIEAIDFDRFVSYSANGRFRVDGDVLLRVNLYPTN